MVTRRSDTEGRSGEEGGVAKLGICSKMTQELLEEMRIKLISHEEGIECSKKSRTEVVGSPIRAEIDGA